MIECFVGVYTRIDDTRVSKRSHSFADSIDFSTSYPKVLNKIIPKTQWCKVIFENSQILNMYIRM